MSKRILIVEDHADIRTLIQMTLEFENYDIQEAPNADQGLEMVRQWRPDVLLLDVMMPGKLDGLDLCRLVKSDPALVTRRLCCCQRVGSRKTLRRG